MPKPRLMNRSKDGKYCRHRSRKSEEPTMCKTGIRYGQSLTLTPLFIEQPAARNSRKIRKFREKDAVDSKFNGAS